jgi:hypothetical protein
MWSFDTPTYVGCTYEIQSRLKVQYVRRWGTAESCNGLTCWQEIFTFKERHNTSSEDVDLVGMTRKVFTEGSESSKGVEPSSPRVCGFRNVIVQMQYKTKVGEDNVIYTLPSEREHRCIKTRCCMLVDRNLHPHRCMQPVRPDVSN